MHLNNSVDHVVEAMEAGELPLMKHSQELLGAWPSTPTPPILKNVSKCLSPPLCKAITSLSATVRSTDLLNSFQSAITELPQFCPCYWPKCV